MEQDLGDNFKERKRVLAEELTRRIHGDKNFEMVQGVSDVMFDKKLDNQSLKAMSAETLEIASEELPSHNIDRGLLKAQVKLESLVTQRFPIFKSASEYRRAIKGNAISINKEKVTDPNILLNASHLIQDKYIMLENGKKNKYMIVA